MSTKTARHPGRIVRSARGGTITRYRMGFLLGVCVGMSFALICATVAYLATRPGSATPPAAGDVATTAPPAAASAAAAVDVTARHLGDLKVLIEAKVNAPNTYDPITMARVVAYADMLAMPRAHLQGPIQLAELGATKGVYQGLTTVAMVGEYDIRVEVLQPMAAVAHERVTVETVAPGGSPKP